MILHSEGHPKRFTELHEEEKREEGVRGNQEEKRGNQKGRVINYLFALHSLEHSERFTEGYSPWGCKESDTTERLLFLSFFLSFFLSVYSCHLFLTSSTFVRSIPFLSFIVPIFAWKMSVSLAQTVKCLPTMWETWVSYLGQEDPLEKEMATPVL